VTINEPVQTYRGPTTGVDETVHEKPATFTLLQNYPNPFNPSTTIRFSLPQREHVTLKIFDINGREVATLVNANLEAGSHDVTFAPRSATSGLYFYRLTTGGFTQTRKLVLMQ